MKRIILILTCLFLLTGCSSTFSANDTSDTLSNSDTIRAYTASLEKNNLRTYIAAYKTQLLYMEMNNTEVDFFIYDFQTNTSKSVGTLSDFALKGRSSVIIDDVLYFYIGTYSGNNIKNVLYSMNFSTKEMTPISENLYSQKLIPIIEIEDQIITLQGNILSDGSLDTFLEIIEDNGTVKSQEVSSFAHAQENHTILYIDSSNEHLLALESVHDESGTQIFLVEYDSDFSCVTTTNITSVFHDQELTDDIGLFYAFDNYFFITDYSGTSIICRYAEGEIETLLCKADLEYVPNLNNSSTTHEFFYVRNTNDIYRLNKQTGILEIQNYSLENDQSVVRCAFAYDDILMVIKRTLLETDHNENLYLIPCGY